MTDQQTAPRQIVHLTRPGIAGGKEPVYHEHVFIGGTNRPPRNVCPGCGAKRSFYYARTIRWAEGRALDVYSCDTCEHMVTRSSTCTPWDPQTGLERPARYETDALAETHYERGSWPLHPYVCPDHPRINLTHGDEDDRHVFWCAVCLRTYVMAPNNTLQPRGSRLTR